MIAELEKCAAPPEEIPETETFHGITPKGKLAGDQTLDLDMPVISPGPTSFARHARKKAKKVKLEKSHIIYGSVALGVLLILGLLGVVFSMQTPEGTLIVEVNQPDAEISVDDGKITVRSPNDNEPVEVEVAEGKHTLEITKGGFRTFAREFEITSRGEEVIRVTLVPLEKEVAATKAKPESKPAPVSQPVATFDSGGNWALEFDGEDDYVELLTLTCDAGRPVTLEALVKPSGTGGHSILALPWFGLQFNGTQQAQVWARTSDGYYQRTSRLLTEGDVLHLAGVFNQKMVELYVNGRRCPRPVQFHEAEPSDASPRELGRDEAISGRFLEGVGFLIGRHHFKSSKNPFHGTIHEVRISNIARYTKDFTPQRRFEPDEHTMALYHFDEGSGDVLHDSSGNGHDGKIVGAKWVKVDEGMGGMEALTDAAAKEPVTLPNGWQIGRPVNLGPTVNSKYADRDPSLSADGLTLLFESDRPGGQGNCDLWMCSRKSVSDPFGEPVNLGPTINSSFNEASPSLSSDGLMLLLDSDRPGGQSNRDLWMCIRKSVSDPFGEPVNLGPAVNTSDEEYCPEISADSLTLLLRSDRPGGQGNHDVWMSTRNSVDVPFGEPVNLGPPINTNAKDGHPTLSSDGLTLIYSSNRQCTPGDSDLWMSTRKSMSVPFGVPVNLGSTVNTNTWEGGPALSSDSLTLFFASGSPDGYGSSDLWMARIVRPGEATSTESSQPPLAIPDNS